MRRLHASEAAIFLAIYFLPPAGGSVRQFSIGSGPIPCPDLAPFHCEERSKGKPSNDVTGNASMSPERSTVRGSPDDHPPRMLRKVLHSMGPAQELLRAADVRLLPASPFPSRSSLAIHRRRHHSRFLQLGAGNGDLDGASSPASPTGQRAGCTCPNAAGGRPAAFGPGLPSAYPLAWGRAYRGARSWAAGSVGWANG